MPTSLDPTPQANGDSITPGPRSHRHSDVLRRMLNNTRIMPILTIEDESTAVPLATALRDGGLNVMEITLRTPVALKSIEAIAKLEGITVGVGTLLAPHDVKLALDAGATFGVSPGITGALIDATLEKDLPLIGGVATASEAMELLNRGLNVAKFYPADAMNAMAVLKAWQGPLPSLGICITGGVETQSAMTYLQMTNVLCVGGSWMTPKPMIRDKNWKGIADLAHHIVEEVGVSAF